MGDFLPVSKNDMKSRGWDEVDFAYVIADAYVDHSSFGPAIISRVLESRGYRVGIIPQPDWKDEQSINVFGKPRLGFLVSGGNMDSMVNHYTVNKKKRKNDAYSPGGIIGKRPDHATVVYCNLIKRLYKDSPIIIGGIEASLRRLAHYDYWSDSLKRSILLDSQADLISYGMGERTMVEIADALDSGLDIKDVTFIDGTVYKVNLPKTAEHRLEESGEELLSDCEILPSYSELLQDRLNYAKSFYIQYQNTDPFQGKKLAEPYENGVYVIQNPPAKPLTQMELDDVYELPYMNAAHPMYDGDGGIPALSEVKFSLSSSRGCFGACSFCALTFHQGRIVQSRSIESLVSEAERMTEDADFKGYIHDVGGPTANFRRPACKKQLKSGACKNRQCLFPEICKNADTDHSEYVQLLKKLRSIPKVKKVFVRSGVRFDFALADKDDRFLQELCKYHVSGQLRAAPEHVSDRVLALMGKPKNEVYQKFVKKCEKINGSLGKQQYVVPYLMSSHPGSELKDAVELAEFVRDMGYIPEQVQDFYPTPSTISTCMYYTGVDPRNMKPVYVAHSPHEKAMQRALIQYKKPENYELVKEALLKAHREDLIGFGEKCLIPPRKIVHAGKGVKTGGGDGSKAKSVQNKADGKKNGCGTHSHAKQGNGSRGKHDKAKAYSGEDRIKHKNGRK